MNIRVAVDNINTTKDLFNKLGLSDMEYILGERGAEELIAHLERMQLFLEQIVFAQKLHLKQRALKRERQLYLFELKEFRKLKKQKAADESLSEIIEACKSIGWDIDFDKLVKDYPEKSVLNMNRLLKLARDNCLYKDYESLLEKLQDMKVLKIEESSELNLLEE